MNATLVSAAFRGVRIVANSNVPKTRESYRQVLFPRSKKRRIQKKWRKRWSNWATVNDGPQAYMIGGVLMAHPDVIDSLNGMEAKP